MSRSKSKPPGDFTDRFLAASRHTCCYCRERKDVVIHHIDEDPSNNNPDNLCVLCTGCHSIVHSNQGLGRKFTPGELKIYRESWKDRCKVEDTKKTYIKNIFLFTEGIPELRNMEFLAPLITNVSSGATVSELNNIVTASTDFVTEVSSKDVAEEFKVFVLKKKST